MRVDAWQSAGAAKGLHGRYSTVIHSAGARTYAHAGYTRHRVYRPWCWLPLQWCWWHSWYALLRVASFLNEARTVCLLCWVNIMLNIMF